jgi:hypothetical protein
MKNNNKEEEEAGLFHLDNFGSPASKNLKRKIIFHSVANSDIFYFSKEFNCYLNLLVFKTRSYYLL